MSEKMTSFLKAGFDRLRKNPQLWWTILVALIIFIAFVFIANLFVTIAQDAQDRLINVRVGSIHDTLVEYVNEIDNQEKMVSIISSIANQNETIEEFKIVSVLGDQGEVIASLDHEEIGEITFETDQLTNFALTDPANSYTTEVNLNDERFYVTVRAYTNTSGDVVGYVQTVQTLSEADRIINDNIRKSILIFILILVVVMMLFLRHAKIIDYTSLYKKLKEVDSLKDDFISMASHELKSPLTAIRGYAEFLRDARELSEKNKEYARRIDVSSKQLATLVEDMLDVSRIEQERMKFEFEKFEIIEFLREQFETFEMQAKNKDLELKFELEGETSQEISLDKNKLRQIYINLLSNAIKYTKKGSVTSKIKIDKDRNVEIRISDTGIGMTKDQVDHLFDKFYRVKTKETEEISGTGLGLWITKQLVEKMNGEISIESIKDKGTDFVVIFPVK
jgi:signal transduction histidine kinase